VCSTITFRDGWVSIAVDISGQQTDNLGQLGLVAKHPMSPTLSVPSRYLFRLLEVLTRHRISAVKYVQNLGLTVDELSESKRRINYDSYLAAVTEVLSDTEIPAFGLKVGRNVKVVDHGVLGYAFISSANLLKGFEIFSLYQKIQGPIVNVSLRRDRSDAIYTAEKSRPIDTRLYKFGIASWLGEATNIRSLFDAGKLEFKLARVAFPEPASADEYRDLLRCDIRFGEPVNELIFPAEFLDLRFSLAEESVAEMCAQQCEEILREMTSEHDVVDDVRRALLHQPGEIQNLDMVARQLNVSARTLRRRLQAADTSFREIQAEVRMSLAAEYLLHTHLPIAEAAHLLGYSDVTAFHRSFKKHYDVTPAQYRQQTAH